MFVFHNIECLVLCKMCVLCYTFLVFCIMCVLQNLCCVFGKMRVVRMSSLMAPMGLVSYQSGSEKQFNEMLSLDFVSMYTYKSCVYTS